MLSEIEEILGIRLCYYLAKIHGLIPFNYQHFKRNGHHSLFSAIYFFIFLTILIALSVYCQLSAFLFVTVNQKKTITQLVFIVELLFGFFHLIVVYLFQFFNRNTYIQLIDEAFYLQNLLEKLNKYPHTGTGALKFDNTFRKNCVSKLYVLLIQIILMLSTLWTLYTTMYTIDYAVPAFFFTYSYILKSPLTFSFFLAQLVLMKFFQFVYSCLNIMTTTIDNIEFFGKKQMKMEIYCVLSDDCDEILAVFKRLIDFREAIWKFFELQLVLVLFDAFVVILSEVIK